MPSGSTSAEVVDYVAGQFAALHAQTRLLARHLVRLDAALLVSRPHVSQHLDSGHVDLPPVRQRPVLWLGRSRLLPGHMHARVAICPGRGRVVSRAGTRPARDERTSASAFDADSGVIRFRGEVSEIWRSTASRAASCAAYREHQMSADDQFLKRNWPKIKRAVQCLIEQGRRTAKASCESNQHNTLDTDWFGPVAWLSGMYLAALRAAEEMAPGNGRHAVRGDLPRDLRARGRRTSSRNCSTANTSSTRSDPKQLDAINSGTGCEIDQVFGQ